MRKSLIMFFIGGTILSTGFTLLEDIPISLKLIIIGLIIIAIAGFIGFEEEDRGYT